MYVIQISGVYCNVYFLFMCSVYVQVIRELDRERGALERQEKKLIADIKKMAKTGQMDAVKIMAKGELVDHATLHTQYPTVMQDPRRSAC